MGDFLLWLVPIGTILLYVLLSSLPTTVPKCWSFLKNRREEIIYGIMVPVKITLAALPVWLLAFLMLPHSYTFPDYDWLIKYLSVSEMKRYLVCHFLIFWSLCSLVNAFGEFLKSSLASVRTRFNNWYWLRSPFRSPRTLQRYFDKNPDILRWSCNQCGRFLNFRPFVWAVKANYQLDSLELSVACICGASDVFTWRRKEGSIGRQEMREDPEFFGAIDLPESFSVETHEEIREQVLREEQESFMQHSGSVPWCLQCGWVEFTILPEMRDAMQEWRDQGIERWFMTRCPVCKTLLQFKINARHQIVTEIVKDEEKTKKKAVDFVELRNKKPLSPEEKLEVFLTKQAKRKVKL